MVRNIVAIGFDGKLTKSALHVDYHNLNQHTYLLIDQQVIVSISR
jgi:hypothetical protein